MANLAINGGSKAAEALQQCVWPRLGPEDEASVLDALHKGNWGGLGDDNIPNAVFEREFAAYHDAKYGITAGNGTLTLELSLRAGGVRPGDEVIVPAVTFVASASAVVSVGAVPIFADVDPNTCQLSAAALEAAITPRTRAVIVVHFGGYMADMDAIMPIANKHNLIVVEDCAHAQGSAWRNKRAGSWGTFGSFSLQHSKALSSGEGGIVITSDEALHEKALLIRNIGRNIAQRSYDHTLSASNWRMGGLQGALALSQFRKFPAQAEARHIHGAWLADELNRIPGLRSFPKDERITQRGYYFLVLDFDEEEFGCSRGAFVQAMHAEGVSFTGTAYARPLYREKAFMHDNLRPLIHESVALPDYESMHLPNAEYWAGRVVTILHWYFLERETAELVVAAVQKIKQNVKELADFGK